MIPWDDVRAAIKPLRFIFWGGILWIFDLTFTTTTNGTGFRCDVLDDTVGTILITVGVFRLAKAPVPGKYSAVMSFVKAVAIASIGETAMKHFIFEHPAPLDFVLSVLSLCQLAATILFCLAMKWFCDAAALPRPAASWKLTFLLFCFIYALPLGFFYMGSLLAIVGQTSFNVDLGIGGLLLLPVFALPLIHLFVSTSRLKRAAESGIAGDLGQRGFPVVLPPDDGSR